MKAEVQVMSEIIYGATVKIDLSALKNNYLFAKSLAPSSKTLAVIKANAYGHGYRPVVESLLEVNVDGFAVANMSEAVSLRVSGICDVDTVLVFQGAHKKSDWSLANQHKLTLMVKDEVQLDYCLSSDVSSDQPIWLKCDTGIHRMGLSPDRCTARIPEIVQKFGVGGFVICSHFACSDEVGLDFNWEQLRILKAIQSRFGLQWSMANSGGVMSFPESHGTWNRPGYMLFGNSPLEGPHPTLSGITVVMTFLAPIIALRSVEPGESVGYSRKWYAERVSRIATVAVGYADGYPRQACNGTPVLLHGERVPLVGRVSMDMITIDVTDCKSEVRLGDVVCLWGKDHLGNVLHVNTVAEHAGTIGCELLTKVTERPRKVYFEVPAGVE